jgi:uncharacterized membrane protein YgcG
MKKIIIALITTLISIAAFSLETPRLKGRVNDYASALIAQETATLEKKLADYEDNTSNQVVNTGTEKAVNKATTLMADEYRQESPQKKDEARSETFGSIVLVVIFMFMFIVSVANSDRGPGSDHSGGSDFSRGQSNNTAT